MLVPPPDVHHKGIVGWFLVPRETFADYDASSFGVLPRLCESPDAIYQVNFAGLIKIDHREIRGELVDFCGRSTIEGEISNSETELKFEKRYDSRDRDVIKYSFEKQGDLWVGRFADRPAFDNAYIFNGQPAQAQIIDIVPATFTQFRRIAPEVTLLPKSRKK